MTTRVSVGPNAMPPETEPSSSSLSGFLENVIAARVETSGHLVPLVFRRRAEGKLADIRSAPAYVSVPHADGGLRPNTSHQVQPSDGPSTSTARAKEPGGEFPDGPRGVTDVQYVRSGGSAQKVGTHPMTGKPFTSRFRGVHRTIPTKRWEAQFRKNGKPTSLGCFDTEESAARAYDKMQMWCELHAQTTGKQAMMNFPREHYKDDVPWLMEITQEALLMQLRKEGRAEAALKRAQTQHAMQNTLILPGGHKVQRDEYMDEQAHGGPPT